jgi:hypothetical protein
LRHLCMCLQCILIRFTPSIIFPHPHFYLFLEQFQQVHCSIFMPLCKVHLPYSPTFTLSIMLPLPTGTYPQTRPVLLSCPSFFNVYIDWSRGVALIFHTCTSYLNRINLFHYLLLLYLPGPLLFNSLQ